MQRGWEVLLEDGRVMSEDTCAWKDVPKILIKRLSLLFDSRRWDLTGKAAYFVRNTASVSPGSQASFRVEKRCIGYYEGATKVLYIVDERTGDFEMLVE
jgi:hypothetical protein